MPFVPARYVAKSPVGVVPVWSHQRSVREAPNRGKLRVFRKRLTTPGAHGIVFSAEILSARAAELAAQAAALALPGYRLRGSSWVT